MYVTKLEGRGILIPHESLNATYLASRAGRGSFEKLASTVKRQRPDITTYWLSQVRTFRPCTTLSRDPLDCNDDNTSLK